MEQEYPVEIENYIKHIESVRTSKGAMLSTIQSLDDMRAQYIPQFPQMIQEITNPYLTDKLLDIEAERIARNLSSYPTIRTSIMANLYLMLVCIRNGTRPSRDKIHDHKHVINASYCQVFITEEKQLQKNTKLLNPSLEVKNLNELLC
jgi:hypothetical protein